MNCLVYKMLNANDQKTDTTLTFQLIAVVNWLQDSLET